MARLSDAATFIEAIRTTRQIRQYTDEPVSDEDTRTLLEIARWTGSSRNNQPWHFIAVTNPDILQQLSQVREAVAWAGAAPLGIAIVLDGDAEVSEAYDEGRVTERILVAAHALGLGGGTAWYGGPDEQAAARRILGIPDGQTARSFVAPGLNAGRKPFDEVVSWNSLGTTGETVD
jgi:nitroreductase